MGCACKVNQQITYLQKKYGDNTPKSKTTHIKDKAILFFKKAFYCAIAIPFIPLIAMYLVGNSIFSKKPINIYKIFNIGQKNV